MAQYENLKFLCLLVIKKHHSIPYVKKVIEFESFAYESYLTTLIQVKYFVEEITFSQLK